MIDLACRLMKDEQVSLFLDFFDESQENFLKGIRGRRWTLEETAVINRILGGRIEFANHFVYWPGASGDYCTAELTQAFHKNNQGRGKPVVKFGSLQDLYERWGFEDALKRFAAAAPNDLYNKGLLVNKVATYCKGF